MSSEKLEALKWRAVAVGPNALVITGDNKIVADVVAAHNATVDEFLREAAPVDDGRNWEIVDRDGCVTVASRPLVELLHHVVSSLTLGWTARPVEPKHVHEWGQVYLDGHRNCLHCDARQVAEWKDEVTK